jgi:hypothetical protein
MTAIEPTHNVTDHKKTYYWRDRARDAGFFRALLCYIIGLTISISAGRYASENITPKSVFVSAYQRSDGTPVREHYRRPPGTAKSDVNFELLQIAAFFGFWGCLIGICRCIWLFLTAKNETRQNEVTQSLPLHHGLSADLTMILLELYCGAIVVIFALLLFLVPLAAVYVPTTLLAFWLAFDFLGLPRSTDAEFWVFLPTFLCATSLLMPVCIGPWIVGGHLWSLNLDE